MFVVALQLSGCGGKAHPLLSGAEGGSVARAGSGGRSESNSGGSAGTIVECPKGGSADEVELQSAVAGASTQGCGECSGRTLGDIVALIQDDYPELAEISSFYDPSAPGSDGSRVYAFLVDSGFRLIFSKGSGDCEAGCIDHEYWYVQTASFCYPYAAGHYARSFDSENNCFRIDGEPLWGFPAVDSAASCDADPTPQDVSGDHRVTARGEQLLCVAREGTPINVVRALTLHVEQNATALKSATVSLAGTGYAQLDGRSFEGEIRAHELVVSANHTATDSACIDSFTLELRYDFALASGHLQFEEAHTPDCASKPNEYCKGYLDVDLGP